jgi:predicted DNA-binding protein (UPF0251 family)
VRLDPRSYFYKPRGVPLTGLAVLELRREELEALALADVQRLAHETAAAQMNVSRPTFSRILAQARRTVATALVAGAALRIGGGDFLQVAPATAPAVMSVEIRGGHDTGARTAPRGRRHDRNRKP